MSIENFIAWVRDPDLSESDIQYGRTLVQAARAELQDADPRDDLLYDIDVELYAGRMPTGLLLDFDRRFGSDSLPYGNLLELEYRQLATDLPEDEWLTTFYARAVGASALAAGGQLDEFAVVIRDMRDTIVKAWQPYAQTSLTEEDITAETVVGHLILRQGVEGWLEALDEMERACQRQVRFDEALAIAENANRLMVATQKLSQRVQQAASPISALEEFWN